MAAVQTSQPAAPFNPNPRTLTWERLESLRLQKLGLSNKYSRHFNVLRSSTGQDVRLELAGSSAQTAQEAQAQARDVGQTCTLASKLDEAAGVSKKVNSLAPFATVGKPTCGYFFSDRTINKKVKFGIPPSDLVKWRNFTPAGSN